MDQMTTSYHFLHWNSFTSSPLLVESSTMKEIIVTLIFLCLRFVTANPGLVCRDENNKPVDWYVLVKLPKSKSTGDSLVHQGLSYAYITSETESKGWQMSTKSIGDPTSFPGRSTQRFCPCIWLLNFRSSYRSNSGTAVWQEKCSFLVQSDVQRWETKWEHQLHSGSYKR